MYTTKHSQTKYRIVSDVSGAEPFTEVNKSAITKNTWAGVSK